MWVKNAFFQSLTIIVVNFTHVNTVNTFIKQLNENIKKQKIRGYVCNVYIKNTQTETIVITNY